MSHFCVLVIGKDLENNIDEILQPYNEANEEYFSHNDVTERYKKDFKERKTPDNKTFLEFCKYWTDYRVINSQDVNEDEIENSGYIEIEKDGNVIRVMSWININGKWDWYEVGGRYKNRIIQKDGVCYDFTYYSDFDSEASKQNNIEDYSSDWSDFLIRLKKDGLFKHLTNKEIDDLRYNVFKERERLFSLYEKEQPNREIKLWDWIETQNSIYNKETLCAFSYFYFTSEYKTFDEFLSSLPSLSVYAILDNKGWVSRGEMGWFGISSNEIKTSEWYKIINDKLNSLEPDDELMIVDCHI